MITGTSLEELLDQIPSISVPSRLRLRLKLTAHATSGPVQPVSGQHGPWPSGQASGGLYFFGGGIITCMQSI